MLDLEVIQLRRLQKNWKFDSFFLYMQKHLILVWVLLLCSSMDAHKWTLNDAIASPFLRKTMFQNFLDQFQKWDQHTYTIAFILVKASNIYKSHKFNKTDRKAITRYPSPPFSKNFVPPVSTSYNYKLNKSPESRVTVKSQKNMCDIFTYHGKKESCLLYMWSSARVSTPIPYLPGNRLQPSAKLDKLFKISSALLFVDISLKVIV